MLKTTMCVIIKLASWYKMWYSINIAVVKRSFGFEVANSASKKCHVRAGIVKLNRGVHLPCTVDIDY